MTASAALQAWWKWSPLPRRPPTKKTCRSGPFAGAAGLELRDPAEEASLCRSPALKSNKNLEHLPQPWRIKVISFSRRGGTDENKKNRPADGRPDGTQCGGVRQCRFAH